MVLYFSKEMCRMGPKSKRNCEPSIRSLAQAIQTSHLLRAQLKVDTNNHLNSEVLEIKTPEVQTLFSFISLVGIT